MASTFVICGGRPSFPSCRPTRPALDQVPHPSTPEDGPVVVLHVLKYHEGRSSEDMELYQGVPPEIALPHGVRIGAWFDVEGTIVGDGRGWDQVRFNVFPSERGVPRRRPRPATGSPPRPTTASRRSPTPTPCCFDPMIDRLTDLDPPLTRTARPQEPRSIVQQSAAIRCVLQIQVHDIEPSRRSPPRAPRSAATSPAPSTTTGSSTRPPVRRAWSRVRLLRVDRRPRHRTGVHRGRPASAGGLHLRAHGRLRRHRQDGAGPQFWPSTYWGPAVAGLTD